MSSQNKNHSLNSSFESCQTEPPVSPSDWANRLFRACCIIIGISGGMLLKDIFAPSVASAATAYQTRSISTHSLKKSCISNTNEAAPHHLSLNKTSNSFRGHPVSAERAIFKIIAKISSIAPILRLVWSQKTEPPQKAFTQTSEQRFRVEERIRFDTTTNKTKRATKCEAIPSGSDLHDGLSLSQKIVEKKFTLSNNSMIRQILKDPGLVMTFKPAYECLTDVSLSYPDQLKILHFTLRKTCSNWLFTTITSFTEKDRDRYSQETYGLHFLLTHPFELNDSLINRASHSFCSSLAWPKPPYPWPQLKQKYFQLIKSDLAQELVDLDTDLGSREPYFLLAGNVRKFAPEYFNKRALEMFKLVDEGMELARKQSTIADKNAILISTHEKFESIRSQTLILFFDKKFPNQRPYEQLFCSTTERERIVSDRELFSVSSVLLKQDLFCNFQSF